MSWEGSKGRHPTHCENDGKKLFEESDRWGGLEKQKGSEAHRDKVGRGRVMIPEKRHSIMSPEIVGRKEGCGLR